MSLNFLQYKEAATDVSDRGQTTTVLWKGKPVTPAMGFWINGKQQLASLSTPQFEHPLHKGGMFISFESLQGVREIPGWTPMTFTSDKGTAIEGLGATKFIATFIRSRERWVAINRSANQPPLSIKTPYREGYRTNTHLLMLLPGLDFPVYLAVNGKAGSSSLHFAMKERERIIGGALAEAGAPDMLRCLFYVWVTAGPFQNESNKAGDKSSVVTPFTLALQSANAEYLEKAFVGPERHDIVVDFFRATEAWVEEWNYPMDGTVPVETATPAAAPAAPAHTPAHLSAAAPAAAPNMQEIAAAAYGGVVPPPAAPPAQTTAAPMPPPAQTVNNAPPSTPPPPMIVPPPAAAPASAAAAWGMTPPPAAPPTGDAPF